LQTISFEDFVQEMVDGNMEWQKISIFDVAENVRRTEQVYQEPQREEIT
jgi:hypothetical protein